MGLADGFDILAFLEAGFCGLAQQSHRLSVLSDRFYVELIESGEDFLRVVFQPNRVHLPRTLKTRSPFGVLKEGCRKALAALAT